MPVRQPATAPQRGAAYLASLIVLLFTTLPAQAQVPSGCPGPEPDWTICGECYGDLNSDGLLNELDRLVFTIYRAQEPVQNLCADFNNSGVVDEFDLQILNCIIGASNGACVNQEFDKKDNLFIQPYCGGDNTRSCLVLGDPDDPFPGGCSDPACCQLVCDIEPFCCNEFWDTPCVNIAQNICEPLGPDTRPDVGNCLCQHTYELPSGNCLEARNFPRCTDERCSDLVCACEPLCCEVAWDENCVELAKTYCMAPCTNLTLAELVCDTPGFEQCCETGNWDASCTFNAANIVINQPGLQIRSFPRNCLLCPTNEAYPDPACLDPIFQQLLCQIDPTYCDPVAYDLDIQDCVSVVIQNYPFCASNWDETCVQVASRLCRWPEPGTRGLGDCLIPHPGAGCADSFCMSIVCACDPLCCDDSMSWDENCVQLAGTHCTLVPSADLAVPGNVFIGGTTTANDLGQSCGGEQMGSCLFQQFTPFCNDAACCQLVCGYDGFCCDNRWDVLCAEMATAACNTTGQGVCGPRGIPDGYPPPSGGSYRSCFEARDPAFCAGWPECSPAGCDRSDCCNQVCYVDPYCCEVLWDQVCADGAEVLCAQVFPDCGSSIAGSCFVPHLQPYCDDAGCCERVCLIDETCCSDTWDEDCVLLAESECTSCGDVYAGSCFSVHPGPACSDEDCCDAVCDVDPICCSDTWDGFCVNLAEFTPSSCSRDDVCGVPTARSCYLDSYLPGCEDNLCCREICKSFDPWCCEVRWDSVCAAQALSVCPPGYIEGRDPCNEFHLTPSCNDPACAASVCSIPGYEECCNSRWDNFCVEAATWICTGLYECPGTGNCLQTNDTPMCEDPACCSVVCTYDPSCCFDVWDNDCAVMAINLCEVPNNPSTADWSCPCIGDCFSPRDPDNPRPGCEYESCCAAVCSIEPLCCTENWDENCAELALTYCGGGIQCGAWTTGSCLEPNTTPYCDDPVCCKAVCVYDPACCVFEWDSFCVAQAAERCLRGCGLATGGPCFYPHPTPGCNNGECCDIVCDPSQGGDSFCCEAQWDDVCANLALSLCEPPECGDYASGNCCEVNFSPNCNDQRCCDAVCDEDAGGDAFCCDTTWDEVCVQLARSMPTACPACAFDCGDPCAGSCCEPNFTPACNDEDCCEAVCADDPFCCDDMWDIACAGATSAYTQCTDVDTGPCPAPQCGEIEAGDCCFPNGTPGCSNEACCKLVCAIDPLCCDVSWDAICSGLANDPNNGCDTCTATLECGDSEAGSCCVPNGTPYCDDSACCELVCVFDELCCFAAWDEDCAELATKIPSCGCAPLAPGSKPGIKPAFSTGPSKLKK